MTSRHSLARWLHAVNVAGMHAFNKQLEEIVFTTIDQQFDLLSVVAVG